MAGKVTTLEAAYLDSFQPLVDGLESGVSCDLNAGVQCVTAVTLVVTITCSG